MSGSADNQFEETQQHRHGTIRRKVVVAPIHAVLQSGPPTHSGLQLQVDRLLVSCGTNPINYLGGFFQAICVPEKNDNLKS
jgi:hypothetical protein